MPGWDNEEPAAGGGGGWNAGPAAPEANGFNAGAAPFGGSAPHYGGSDIGDLDGGAEDGNIGDDCCRYCKKQGHFARECPEKPPAGSGCFNCGEEGHNKADCPQPRKSSGPCRFCQKDGHIARDCAEKPAEACRNCRQEGHVANDCKNDRYLDKSHIADRTQDEAWELMSQASTANDFDSFKEHMLEYIKATPGMKMNEMEEALRTSKMRYYLYALSFDEIPYDKVIVGPNGELSEELIYIWSLNKSARPRRVKTTGTRMAATAEENLARLEFAGTLEDDNGQFCHTCKQKGHLRKDCEMGEVTDEFERVIMKCTNCDSLDHRLRDCTQDRKPDYNPNACRNCGEEGHRANECEKPRVADAKTQCRKCEEFGHFSKECPNAPDRPPQVCFNCYQEGHRSSDCTNEKVIKCRNCDEIGHSGKDCPKPRDITRVKCNKCNEMGHYASRCTNEAPPAEEEDNAYGAGSPAPSVHEVQHEPQKTQNMGSWGKQIEAEANPVGTWAANVEPTGGDGW